MALTRRLMAESKGGDAGAVLCALVRAIQSTVGEAGELFKEITPGAFQHAPARQFPLHRPMSTRRRRRGRLCLRYSRKQDSCADPLSAAQGTATTFGADQSHGAKTPPIERRSKHFVSRSRC